MNHTLEFIIIGWIIFAIFACIYIIAYFKLKKLHLIEQEKLQAARNRCNLIDQNDVFLNEHVTYEESIRIITKLYGYVDYVPRHLVKEIFTQAAELYAKSCVKFKKF